MIKIRQLSIYLHSNKKYSFPYFLSEELLRKKAPGSFSTGITRQSVDHL